VLPKGPHFIEYRDFQDAYETLKRCTSAFSEMTVAAVTAALLRDSLAFVVLRTILGVSPSEWAELARSELGIRVDQGTARKLDVDVRHKRDLFQKMALATSEKKVAIRTRALVDVAVRCLQRGAPAGSEGSVHRLKKADTEEGLVSLQHVANRHVPYAVLLYERYLGRPYASHRDSVSEYVGDVMESAITDLLVRHKVTFRKTGRAERVPGFDQAPDFFVPSEFDPAIVIEAKISNDDGTARDKVARLKVLAEIRERRLREGRPSFELVACVDGRGFGVRAQDMRDMLIATEGKVFTLRTLPALLTCTRLREFISLQEG